MKFYPLFNGSRLRFAPPQADDSEHFARWTLNDEYLRLLDNDPARPLSPEMYAKWDQGLWEAPNTYVFRLRTLSDDTLIGFVVLGGIQWTHGVANFGITIGDPAYWGQGYGPEAIFLALRYGFLELNLYRVSSSAMSYNHRSVRAHEKAGFRREGEDRAAILRQGRRYDVVRLGILRDEWLALHNIQIESDSAPEQSQPLTHHFNEGGE